MPALGANFLSGQENKFHIVSVAHELFEHLSYTGSVYLPVDMGKFGMSSYWKISGSTIASAIPPHPVPRMIPIFGLICVWEIRNLAIVSNSS